MNSKNTSVLGVIKKILLVVVTAILLILICFTFLTYHSSQKKYEDKLITNAFAKQTMYSQMISKDASRLYSLMLSLDTNKFYSSEYDVLKRIAEVKSSLIHTRDNFSETLTSLHEGMIIIDSKMIKIDTSIAEHSGNLKKLDDLWMSFEKEIGVLINSETTNEEMAEAVLFITDQNVRLLDYSEYLLEEIQELSLQADRMVSYIAYALIGLLLIIILFSFIQMRYHLILPFTQLYKGISEIGLEQYPANHNVLTKKKILPVVTEINDMFKKISYLISLIENINNNDSFMDTLNFINKTFSSFIPYNYIGIALIDESKEMLKSSYGVSDDTIIGMPDRIMGASWPISDTSMGELFHTGEARIINNLEDYCQGRPVKPYNSIIMQAGIKASITLPLKVSGQPVGMIFFSSSQKNVYNEGHLKFLKTLANSIAISLDQNIFKNDVIFSSILALAKLAETRDEETGEHLDRIAIYAREIAELVYANDGYPDEISFEFIDRIERFSPLHDIGKVGILDSILLKPGRLTSEEYEDMKKHAAFGAQVLRSAEQNILKKGKSLFSMGIDIAEAHHEKWDGTGYPHGRKGREIPLSARIVAVADVFDALTSRRPYKEAYSLETSLNIILEGRGKHFDPVIIDILKENRERFEKVYHAASLLK